MVIHSPISILFLVTADDDLSLKPLYAYLQSMPHIELTIESQIPPEFNRYDVIVTKNTGAITDNQDDLRQFVLGGGGWLSLLSLSEAPLPELFGAQPTPVGPLSELRVLFADNNLPVAVRLPNAIYVSGHYQSFEKTAEDTETILYADWHHRHRPVLVARSVGDGRVACTTLQAYAEPAFQQILYRLIRKLAGQPLNDNTIKAGLLGYSPFIGKQHGLGIEATAGLVFSAICDVSAERRSQAIKDFPGVKAYDSVDSLAGDLDVDLVIVCTPPNTHASLSLMMMGAGKHVLCEKPLALDLKEARAMVEMAQKHKLHLSCYQNRRWDVDYLAIKQALVDGLIGELFYMETFVGGFSHPCGYWHSHDEISGGTAYDWGAHYLDWMVGLIPERITAVIGTRHKRVWHDVSNADQERIQIRFAGGQEAEFLHSDIAAVPKPKWYLLGTEGAIIGNWQNVTHYETDAVHYFHEHHIPPTEMTPDLTLYRRHPSGQVVAQKLTMPMRQPYLMYRNLADHLLTGEPIEAPLEHSVLVVAILEAAKRSAANGGAVEEFDG
jgi:predicted dehydrogenase